MIDYAFSALLPHLTRIAARANSAVPSPPALSIFFLNRSSATYISPSPEKISSVPAKETHISGQIIVLLTAAQQEVPDLLRWWDELRSRAAFFRTLY